jgi:diaminohydroxyphosphoribosylaminopyrimidine deaminase/5-amino-6-(5-phosphoribosylamino)uracil reductase
MGESDLEYMRSALELAERGRGEVEPNPLVGAVVVRNGQIVGTGWHERYGQAHAEVNALAGAGEAASGATLYVTLEPCCHHGKTPPCTDAVFRAGIRRVVAAMADPNPAVAGKGAALLRAAGVVVEIGLREAEARRQNAPYLKLLATGRPYVHAKWAMSLDGKIATRTGSARWISGPASRARVHTLRERMDAILVGNGTVRADDPLLTARPPGPRTPVRIVLSSTGLLPPDAQLVRTAHEVPVLIVTTSTPDGSHKTQLMEAGCEVLSLEASPAPVPALLDELGRRQFTNLLVEGGAAVLGSFFDARAIDEAHIFIAPLLIGGSAARSPVAGHGVSEVTNAIRLLDYQIEQLDGDVYVHGRVLPT